MKSTLGDRMKFTLQEDTMTGPTRAECETKIAKYQGDQECRQALEHYTRWLDYYNSGEKPTMVPASSLEKD